MIALIASNYDMSFSHCNTLQQSNGWGQHVPIHCLCFDFKRASNLKNSTLSTNRN